MEQQYTQELLHKVENETNEIEASVAQKRLNVADVEAEVAVLEKELQQQDLVNQETREVELAFSLVHDQIDAERGGRRV